MQPFSEIEEHYTKEDPWNYRTSREDQKRKFYILHMLHLFGPYKRALDLGCGEGWITADIPAEEIYGYDLSNQAVSRFPDTVKRCVAPEGSYDLIMGTGIMYAHYNWPFFLEVIKRHAGRYILLSNIKDWEVAQIDQVPGFRLLEMEFPYKPGDEAFVQKLRMYEV